MNRNLALAAAALAVLACTPDFDPASKIDKLRVLGVQAEPPEIAPPGDPSAAHTAAITSLVLRADFDADPARTTTIAYVACVPTPHDPALGEPEPTPCVALASLRDPTAALAGAAQTSCAAPGPQMGPTPFFAGVEVCSRGTCGPASAGGTPLPSPELAVTTAVAQAFAQLPDGAPDRILGVQAVVLGFTLDATPDELVQGAGTMCPAGDVAARLAQLWPAREHVLSTKRVVIRGPEAPDAPNENPRATSGGPGVTGIKAGAVELDPAAATTLTGGALSLTPIVAPDAELELYTKRDAAGTLIESTTEAWAYSWFSTAGDLDELHTHGTDPEPWTVSGAPGGTPALVAVVVRDLRGGMAWQVRRVNVTP